MLLLAAFDWPSLPSPRPVSGRHSRDRRGGETCELNVTQWLTTRRGGAVVQGHMPVYPWAIWLKWRHYEWPLVIRSLPSRCWTQRPRPFARRLPEGSLIQSRTLVAIFDRYTDLLSAYIGLRIGLQIFTLWQKSKIGVRIIFDYIWSFTVFSLYSLSYIYGRDKCT